MNSSHITDARTILAEVARGEHGVTTEIRWAAGRAETRSSAREFLCDALAGGELKGEIRWAVRTLVKAGALA